MLKETQEENTMKIAIFAMLAACAISTGALAKGGSHFGSSHAGSSSSSGGSHSVKGYTRKDGTYVPPSHATNPDTSRQNNWSHKGNVNPYTGKEGTKE